MISEVIIIKKNDKTKYFSGSGKNCIKLHKAYYNEM